MNDEVQFTLTSHDGHSLSIACPRCGYDLRGMVSTWRDSCPLIGRCTECGLDFDFGHAFHVTAHPWLFEHHWHRQFIRSLLHTLRTTMVPGRFWREVTLHHRIELLPLVVLVVSFATLFLLATTLNSILLIEFYRGTYETTTGLRMNDVPMFVIGFIIEMIFLIACAGVHLSGPIVLAVALPFVFFVLPITVRRAKVRPVHLARIALYGSIPPLIAATCWTLAPVPGFLFNTAGSWFVTGEPHVWGWPVYTLHLYNNISIVIAVTLIFGLWWAVWWCYSCRRYLRLERPTLVWMSIMLMAILAALTTTSWVEMTVKWNVQSFVDDLLPPFF